MDITQWVKREKQEGNEFISILISCSSFSKSTEFYSRESDARLKSPTIAYSDPKAEVKIITNDENEFLDLNVGEIRDNQAVCVYPNPVANELNFEFNINSPENIEILIFDAMGRLIKQLTHDVNQSGNSITVTIENTLPAGIYYYRVNGKREFCARKVH